MNNITITKDNLQQDYDLLSKDYMRVINENEKKRNAMVVKEHVVTIEDKQAKEEAKLLQKTNDELNTKIHGLNLNMSKLTAENQLLKNKLTRLQKKLDTNEILLSNNSIRENKLKKQYSALQDRVNKIKAENETLSKENSSLKIEVKSLNEKKDNNSVFSDVSKNELINEMMDDKKADSEHNEKE